MDQMTVERDHTDWLPREGRRRVKLVGSGQWPDGTAGRVLVSNVSYTGCHVWTDHDLVQGEIVDLDIPGTGKIQGQLRWVRGSEAGVRFVTGDSVLDSRRARLGF
jgi:hypothetical protein